MAVIVTVDDALFTWPSLTVSVATYVPATSAVNAGLAEVAPARVTVLPAGLLAKLHE